MQTLETDTLAHLFEGMFLIDNDRVRAGWAEVKSAVTQLLAKHGASVHTARRWDERALAYPIQGKRRATFLLAYFEAPGETLAAMRRDLEISETVLRYLHLSADEVPDAEREAAALEDAADFQAPPPPPDDAAPYQAIQSEEDLTSGEGDEGDDTDSDEGDDDSDEDAKGDDTNTKRNIREASGEKA